MDQWHHHKFKSRGKKCFRFLTIYCNILTGFPRKVVGHVFCEGRGGAYASCEGSGGAWVSFERSGGEGISSALQGDTFLYANQFILYINEYKESDHI